MTSSLNLISGTPIAVAGTKTHPSPPHRNSVTCNIHDSVSCTAVQIIMRPTASVSKRQKTTPLRRKSCLQCAKSKVRCSLERPSCARCIAAGRQCRYAAPADVASSTTSTRPSVLPIQSIATPVSLSTTLTDPADISPFEQTLHGVVPPSTPDQATNVPEIENHEDPLVDFSNLALVPLDDADQIRDRWLRPFLAVPEQVSKSFHPFTLQYISCVLRTYPKQMAGNKCVPPIVHPMQMSERNTPVALANCYSLVRLWHHRAEGSEAIVADTIQREMNRLAHDVRSPCWLQPCFFHPQ